MNFEKNISAELPHLRRYARALCRDPHTAEDLVQDCLERAFRKRHLWRPKGRLRAWLFRILYRTYLNQLNSAPARREVITQYPADHISQAGTQESHAYCHDVMAFVDELPVEQRAAMLLLALEGPSYKDAARILEINIGTLRSRLARARETVRQRSEEDPRRSEIDKGLRRVK